MKVTKLVPYQLFSLLVISVRVIAIKELHIFQGLLVTALFFMCFIHLDIRAV